MKTQVLRIDFLSPWHAGTGLGGGPEADALVLRDAQGLPYLPGRTILGLLREAVQTLEDSKAPGAEDATERLFAGKNREFAGQAQLDVRNAVLEPALAAELVTGKRAGVLTDRFTTTAINEQGLAKGKTLRSVEAAVPLTLLGRISFPAHDAGLIQDAVALVRTLGRGRHRGFGRCQWRLVDLPAKSGAPQTRSDGPGSGANERWFRITLRSEVFISRTGGTLTAGEGLDYLPGALFLGAVASCQRGGRRLFQKLGAAMFSSGHLRFGDGLPLAADGRVGLPMPLSLHRWKDKKGDGLENFAAVAERIGEAYADEFRRGRQPKQQRNGYYVPAQGNKPGAAFQLETTLRLKSATDRNYFDRSEDEKLFGYRVLPAGARFVMRVSWHGSEGAAPWDDIEHALCRQPLRLGRSRRAEFGWAEAELIASPSIVSVAAQPPPDRTGFLLLSDALLLQAGRTALAPSPEAFGLDDKEWVWDVSHSFIRTRCYSPWNGFLHSRTMERQVLVRGSVVVFERRSLASQPEATPMEVGGVAEGLGWWVRDPDFLWQVKLPLPEETEAYACHRNNPPAVRAPAPLSSLQIRVLAELGQRKHALEHELAARTLADLLVSRLREHERHYHIPARELPGPAQWAAVRKLAQASSAMPGKFAQKLAAHCQGSAARKQAWVGTGFDDVLAGHLVPQAGNESPPVYVLVRAVALAAGLMREKPRKENRS